MNTGSDTTETHSVSLVHAARAGDRDAYGELVRTWENAAFATALGYGLCREDAADIVQDSFIKAYCRLVHLKEPARFGWWLRSIVQRSALEFLRRRRTVEFVSASAEAGQNGLITASECERTTQNTRTEVMNAVLSLPVQYREMVLMHYVEGISYDAISRYLHVPVSTVKGRLYQARIRLKRVLSDFEGKERVMGSESVEKNVTKAVHQIASRNQERKVALEGADRVVIYCGMKTGLEVCRTDGPDVVVTSTALMLGPDGEAAEKALDGLKVVADRVDDYASAGPFPDGTVPVGGVMNFPIRKSGEPILPPLKDTQPWQSLIVKEWSQVDKFLADEGVFSEDHRILERERAEGVLNAEGSAVRVTTMREEVIAIEMDRSAYTDDVKRIFRSGWSKDNIVQGVPGQINLVVAVPDGVNVTVLCEEGPAATTVWGLHADITMVNDREVELKDIRGNVDLINTQVRVAESVHGSFRQTWHSQYGTNWPGGEVRRWKIAETELIDISGTIEVDVSKVNLEVRDCSGEVSIRNRYGDTRFHLEDITDGDVYRYTTESGRIFGFLSPEAVEASVFMLYSECGTISYHAFKGVEPRRESNYLHHMFVAGPEMKNFAALRNGKEPVFNLKAFSRAGDISIEKT